MSDNFNHNLEFRDLKSLQVLLNMPNTDHRKDIEVRLIEQEEAHLLQGSIKGIALSLHDWVVAVGQRTIARLRFQPRQTQRKSHSYVQR